MMRPVPDCLDSCDYLAALADKLYLMARAWEADTEDKGEYAQGRADACWIIAAMLRSPGVVNV